MLEDSIRGGDIERSTGKGQRLVGQNLSITYARECRSELARCAESGRSDAVRKTITALQDVRGVPGHVRDSHVENCLVGARAADADEIVVNPVPSANHQPLCEGTGRRDLVVLAI